MDLVRPLLDPIRSGADRTRCIGSRERHASLAAGLATGDIQLLETADKALYEAKHQGRNKVIYQPLT